MVKNQMKANEIATEIFVNGGRSRDCEVKSKLKTKYDESFTEEILEQLARIEFNHLWKIK